MLFCKFLFFLFRFWFGFLFPSGFVVGGGGVEGVGSLRTSFSSSLSLPLSVGDSEGDGVGVGIGCVVGESNCVAFLDHQIRVTFFSSAGDRRIFGVV